MEELKNRIHELLKDTNLEQKYPNGVNGWYVQHIREAEILTALNSLETIDSYWCMESDGWISKVIDNETIDCNYEQWQLGKSLEEQPKEVRNFLKELLCKNN